MRKRGQSHGYNIISSAVYGNNNNRDAVNAQSQQQETIYLIEEEMGLAKEMRIIMIKGC